jgi:uncharacterized repeat protein (TIGR01451 family)
VEGVGVALVDAAGRQGLRIRGLEAWDADGQPIESRLEVAGKSLRLTVDSAGARFPVTVDPTFIHEARLLPHVDPIGRAYHRVGTSVALVGDTAVVGAPGDGVHPGLGAVYVFTRSGGTWSFQQRIISSNQDPNAPEQFGTAVALSGDTLVVGAPYDSRTRWLAGSAYVFAHTSGKWSEAQRLASPAPAEQDNFGMSVSISADTILVGAPAGSSGRPGAAHVFVRSGSSYALQQTLEGAGAAGLAGFGRAVSLLGDLALVGAPQASGATAESGAVYAFVRSGSGWTQQAKMAAPDGENGDSFGSSVAVSVETALIGAPLDSYPGASFGGSVYAFVRASGIWSFQQRLQPNDVASGDNFGSAVSIVGDLAVIGAPTHDLPSSLNHGAAYVFGRGGGTWSQTSELVPGPGAEQGLGMAAALSGNTVLLGAPAEDRAGVIDAGAAYPLDFTGASWVERPPLLAGDDFTGDRFGVSVSLSGDILAVGALMDDTALGVDNGSASVFKRTGASWAEVAKLTSPTDGGPTFGFAVAVSGSTVAVGAPQQAGRQGSVYVFVASGGGYTLQQQLVGSVVSGMFGRAVALSGDTLLVGAHSDNLVSGDPGSVFVYIRAGGVWSLQQQLLADDRGVNDAFGESVAVEGNTALVGAQWADVGGRSDAGAAYVFVRNGATWSQQQKLVAPDPENRVWLGRSVSLSGDTAILGAPFNLGDRGAAYVFVRSGSAWALQQKITVSATPQAQFGTSVSVSGEKALVGAVGDGPRGAVYLFERSGGTWSSRLRYSSSEGGNDPGLGAAVSLSAGVGASGDWSYSTPSALAIGAVDILAEGFADLGVTKSDGVSQVAPGTTLGYQIVVSNAGPHPASGAHVVDTPPSTLSCSTTCSGTGGATCASGLVGPLIDDRPVIPAGQSVTYVASCQVSDVATGTIVNSVAVSPPAEITDQNPVNDAASDVDTVVAAVSIRDAVSAKTDAAAVFEVVLSEPSASSVSVAFATADGSAQAGVDYLATTRAVAFPAGVTRVEVPVTLLSPSPPGTRSFFARLSTPVNTTVGRSQARALLAAEGAMGFTPVTPCRLVDTRDPGLGGPLPLRAGETTRFAVSGHCGIPAGADSIVVNITTTGATVGGHLRAFSGGADLPDSSLLNYSTGQTRANNAVLSLGAAGDVAIYVGQPSGTVHVLIDVGGYFASYLE